MPSKIIIIKNPSATPIVINDFGTTIPSQSQFIVTEFFRLEEIWESQELGNLVSNASVLINDGEKDLTSEAGILYISPVQTDRDLDYEIDVTYNYGEGNNVYGVARWTPDGYLGGIIPSEHSARHAPNGQDPIPSSSTIAIGQSNAAGIANSFARSDHDHKLKTANDIEITIGTITPGQLLQLDGTTIVGAASSNPSATNPSSTTDGDIYYNTQIKELMVYDAYRALWVTTNTLVFDFGRNAPNHQAGAYFRITDGITMSNTLGFYATHAGTITAFYYSRIGTTTAAIEILSDGNLLTTITTNLERGAEENLTLNFNAGSIISARSQLNTTTINSLAGSLSIKWRT